MVFHLLLHTFYLFVTPFIDTEDRNQGSICCMMINCPVVLASIIGVLRDQMQVEINADESEITRASKMVESFSGIRIPVNKPIIGENVFTQTSGVHADGDSKDNLYFNNLLPERFGRKRKYALGKQSGKATIRKNLEEFGLDLSPESLAKVPKFKHANADQNMTAKIDGLKQQGVNFSICANTVKGRKVEMDMLHDANPKDIVPSGVAELSHLQHAGYTYIKP